MSTCSSSDPCGSPAARRAWLAVLARVPRDALADALGRVLAGGAPPPYDWLRPPETGLAMVRGRIGGTGDAFNLGEATVTRATLRLRASEDGAATVGVACHLGRDKRRAELAALADALLQQPDRHARAHAELIEPFRARQAAERAARADETATTRVEFFTMVRGD
jgi:alpha-D-ribose 1-methylphosphonate 5-triphosphate synthase subunit PhnG